MIFLIAGGIDGPPGPPKTTMLLGVKTVLIQFKSHLSERSHDAVPFLVLLAPPFQKHAPGKMSYISLFKEQFSSF